MVAHKNFYETVAEAEMRLKHTLIMYDGEPYYVLAITNHMPDGVFRIYLDKMMPREPLFSYINTVPYDSPAGNRGAEMDKFIDGTPSANGRIIRKKMNSPKFDRFRPFPLGMVNYDKDVYYVERAPTRHTQQGLTENMLRQSKLSITPKSGSPQARFMSLVCDPMYHCIVGNYPSFQECITNLKDPDVTNVGVAFDRSFALMRGPLDLLFLAYKDQVIGYLPNRDDSELILDNQYLYTVETISELGIFNTIKIKEK